MSIESKLTNNRIYCKGSDLDNGTCKEIKDYHYYGSNIITLTEPTSANDGLNIVFNTDKKKSFLKLNNDVFYFRKAKLFRNSYSKSRNIIASMVLYHSKTKGGATDDLEIHIPFQQNSAYYNSLMWLNNILYKGVKNISNTKTKKITTNGDLTLNDMVPLNTPYYYVKETQKEYIFFDRYFPLSMNFSQLSELKKLVDENSPEKGKLPPIKLTSKPQKIFYNNRGIQSESIKTNDQPLTCTAIKIDGKDVVPKEEKDDSDLQASALQETYKKIFESEFFTIIIGIIIAMLAFAIMKNILEAINGKDVIGRITGGIIGANNKPQSN